MSSSQQIRKVLNVGGGNKSIPLPHFYNGWEHLLLDIDPKGKPDIVCDARNLKSVQSGQFDVVYCSHNLEHYFRHDVPKVLAGFLHVLKPDGFVHLRVPDLGELMKTVVQKGMDIEDTLYHAPAGPISVRDVIYGLSAEIERSGSDFYAHKTGFTMKSLLQALKDAGFNHVFGGTGSFEIVAFAFRETPGEFAKKLLGLH